MGGAEKLLFRGLSLSQILNSTFSELISVLSALPKSSLPLKLIKLLGLEVLPLGMPLALLSFSERRRVQLVTAALAGQSATRPQVAIVELPFVGLSEKHAHAVEALLRDSDLSPNTCWLVPAQQ
jgi:excinuclease UvrABC ATPase subunit